MGARRTPHALRDALEQLVTRPWELIVKNERRSWVAGESGLGHRVQEDLFQQESVPVHLRTIGLASSTYVSKAD